MQYVIDFLDSVQIKLQLAISKANNRIKSCDILGMYIVLLKTRKQALWAQDVEAF